MSSFVSSFGSLEGEACDILVLELLLLKEWLINILISARLLILDLNVMFQKRLTIDTIQDDNLIENILHKQIKEIEEQLGRSRLPT